MNVYEQAKEAINEFMNNHDKETITITIDKDYYSTGGISASFYSVNPKITISTTGINNLEDN